jgi:hypothetical protein
MKRCKRGDLAEIIKSDCGNTGRRVIIEKFYRYEDGMIKWTAKPIQPLKPLFDKNGCDISMNRIVIPDICLRPIQDSYQSTLEDKVDMSDIAFG